MEPWEDNPTQAICLDINVYTFSKLRKSVHVIDLLSLAFFFCIFFQAETKCNN